jgi:iron complex outermembrane recepter protein
MNHLRYRPRGVPARSVAAALCLIDLLVSRSWAEDSSAVPQLQEVIVTAQKRSEREQDVPMSMTALDSSALLSQGQLQLADYAKTIPGLSFSPQDQGQTLLDIRGLSTGRGTNPTVGITIDDVPFGPSLAFVNGDVTFPDLDPADLQQVEVLRGPQGTLYGASSMGGLVKFVTADPSLSAYSGFVETDAASVDHGGVGEGGRARVTAPLIDEVLALGLSGFWRADPGYVDDPEQGRTNVNGAHVRGGHLTLLWRPSESVSLKVAALLQDTYGAGSSEIDTNYELQPVSGKYTQNRIPGSGPYVDRVRLYTAVLTADLGFAELTSVTGYNTSVNDSIDDETPTFGGFNGFAGAMLDNYFYSHKTTEEIRLASHQGGAFEWLLGGFYARETDGSNQVINSADLGTGADEGLIYNSSFPETVREYAVFANATYHITDRWAIQGGVRYAHDEETYTEHDTGPLIGGFYDVPEVKSEDHPVTYLFTASYKVMPDLMVYLRESSGYRPGGPNAGAAALGLPDSYKSDKTNNSEIGVKGSAFDHMLSFDADVFYIDWRDIQLTVEDPTTGIFYFDNGGKARSTGLEGSLRAQPFPTTTIAATAAYTDAILKSDLPPGSYGVSGERLPYSAKISGSVSIDQDVRLNARWIGFLGATGAYTGNRFDTFPVEESSVRPELPAYATLDLRLGVRDASWKISAYVTNVTDKYGILTGHPNDGLGATTSPFFIVVTRPRTVGLSVGYAF